MRGSTKMFMVSNYWSGGNRDTHHEMDDAYSDMRRDYQGGHNESRVGRYGETRGNYPRETYGRSEGDEMRNGGVMDPDEVMASRRYRRRSDGTFAPRSDGARDYPPPVYRGRDDTMNRVIGFAQPQNRMDYNYRSDAAYSQMDETKSRHSDTMMGGASGHKNYLDEEMAEEWMQGLHNSDGTKGPHWTKEQVKQLVAQRKLDMDVLDAWVAMNAVYSDYCKVAKAHNVNNIDFYVAMAKAFAEDEDAKDDKLALYYECIVK